MGTDREPGVVGDPLCAEGDAELVKDKHQAHDSGVGNEVLEEELQPPVPPAHAVTTVCNTIFASAPPCLHAFLGQNSIRIAIIHDRMRTHDTFVIYEDGQ